MRDGYLKMNSMEGQHNWNLSSQKLKSQEHVFFRLAVLAGLVSCVYIIWVSWEQKGWLFGGGGIEVRGGMGVGRK